MKDNEQLTNEEKVESHKKIVEKQKFCDNILFELKQPQRVVIHPPKPDRLQSEYQF